MPVGVGQDGDVPHRRIAVAATGQQALDAGLAVADDGGNAVDAALATAFTALATEPGMVSFGGGAYVSVWMAGERPGRGRRQRGDARAGRRSGAVRPRRARGAYRLRRRGHDDGWLRVGGHAGHHPGVRRGRPNGTPLSPGRGSSNPLPLAARRLPDGEAASRYLAFTADTLFAEDAEAHALVTGDGGALLSGGEERSNLALAETLERLAVEGPSLFSTGEVGRALAAAMAEHDGLITTQDLAAYEPVVRPAHLTRAGAWTVAVNPPPAVGGPMLAVMLGELARRGDWTWDDVIEIQRAVLSYRTSVHDFSYDLEADGVDLLARVGEHGLTALRGSSSTANVSAVDSDGNACTITMSSGYSAGLVIPGTGILLNNALGEVELNRLGVHALAAGHSAGLQHGPHHCALAVRPGAGDRLPRCRPHHHGADAGAGPGLPARPRPRAAIAAPRHPPAPGR